jgi:hypothetical protein
MSLLILPSDVIKIIIWKCDILSLLRLERVCVKFRRIINDKFWKAKFTRTDSYRLAKVSPNNRIRMIMREINIKRERLKKKYGSLIKITPDENLVKDIKYLHKNLTFYRNLYPLEKKVYIIYRLENTNINYNEIITKLEKYGNISEGTLVGIYEYTGNFPVKFLVKMEPDVFRAWKDVNKYFHEFKSKYCLSKEELEKLYDLPFKLDEEFDYI